MATTHAVWGMALALPVIAVAPELAPIALAAGFVGGLFPDLDLYMGHRKTLHYPVLGPLLAALAIAIAGLNPTTITIGLAVFVSAAALHPVLDIFGGGLELRPWEATSDRGVYSHVHRRWIRPRRTIRYDGSPEDLGFAVVGAAPLFFLDDATIGLFILGLLVISSFYVLLRRRLAEAAAVLASVVPAPLVPYVPRRYLTAHDRR